MKPGIIFCPKGNKVAYIAQSNYKWFAVVDGKEEKQYDVICFLVFSPDGNNVAYIGKLGNKEFVVIDGKEGNNMMILAKYFLVLMEIV